MYNKITTMNKEFLKMQKSAGLITESEFKEKLNEIEDDTAHYVPNTQGASLDFILMTLQNIYDAGKKGEEMVPSLKQDRKSTRLNSSH